MSGSELHPGDFVYHPSHGTARYLGIRELEDAGRAAGFLQLEFAGGDKVYMPLEKASLLEKVPADSGVRVDRLRKSGPPPPPPKSLILDRASRSVGGGGADGSASTRDSLLQRASDVSAERREAVEKARLNWISRLIDQSRRNRLLFFQALKVRTVELTDEEADRALPLVAGESVSVARIFPPKELVHGREEDELFDALDEDEPLDLGVARKLQEIQKRGDEDFEERGLETVYCAFGMATWRPEDQGRPPEAAVILVPIGVEGKGARLVLEPKGDLEINLALVQVLEELGCEGLGNRLDAILAQSEEVNPRERMELVFKELLAGARGVPGFSLTQKAVVANFAFHKLAMVRDLQRWQKHMAGHDIVSAIAGDLSAKRELSEQRTDADPRELDERPPEQEFLVMDADSSQQRSIAGILKGQSGVVIGPPGTGKSQTIANLIGELVAHGQRVLFVAEKRAALDVVRNRLDEKGLGELILDLHGAVSRKQIMAQFAVALESVRNSTPPRVEELHREFVTRRQRLNEYTERLHQRREPSGYSAYDLMGHLLAAEGAGAESKVRWRGNALKRLKTEEVATIADALESAGADASLFLRTSRSLWTNAALPDRPAVEAATAAVDQLSQDLIPDLASVTEEWTDTVGLQQPQALADYEPLLALQDTANHLAQTYLPEFFTLDLPALALSLAPARSFPGRVWAFLTNSSFRAARSQLATVARQKVSGGRALGDIESAQNLVTSWAVQSHNAATVAPYDNVASVKSSKENVDAALSGLALFVGLPAPSEPAAELDELLTGLAADRQTPPKIPAIRAYEAELSKLGVQPFVDELRATAPATQTWVARLRYAWLASCMDQVLLDEPELAVFNGRQHDEVVERFKELDRARVMVAVERVRRAYGESVVAAANKQPEQNLLVRKQAALRSRHLPFRDLVRRAPDIVTSIKPCWMASPLAVSQLMGGTQQYFDVVIFDEASQVLPEDAITAILRGKSVVVAGDPNQLPPTQFFAADRDEEGADPGEDTEGFESVLDVMVSFLPQWSLDWHYRSRDERLVSFSNHYIYDGRLITFPSTGGTERSVSHVLVPQLPNSDADEQSSSAEVRRVVELIFNHADTSPALSLGVIAMGIKHSNRIDAELAKARRARPDLDDFFDGHPEEKFFVKNLERVQGDERDSIILSIGYGKDASGKLPYRFGPLLSEGGHRRLNVAVTRAKQRITLVSSFSHADMDPARSTKRGVELLRLYLEYTASGGQVFGDSGPAPVERNEFEIQVQAALERMGLEVIPQYGASHYRIDMVVQHPDQPGRSILAIECDGAAYHSAPTARDRDRLRQEHLEARGWRFVRIWSTDWFTRRDEEIARVMEAYRKVIGAPSVAPEIEGTPATRADVAETSSLPFDSRAPRPPVPRSRPITEYQDFQLLQLVHWIRSDGRLRTDDELLEELMADLRFERRGRRIEAVLRNVIERGRPRGG